MNEEPATFEGFPPPIKNFFSLPNEMINIIAHIKNMAELKVIIYVIRHTWGFHEYGICKTISVDEFMHGRRKGDGSRMDEGTGLSHHSVIDGLRDAEQHGYLICKIDGSDLARVKKSYMLKMINRGEEVAPPEDTAPPEEVAPGAESTASSAISASGSEESAPRSEKDTLETHSLKERENNAPAPLSFSEEKKRITNNRIPIVKPDENETTYHIDIPAIGNDADGDEETACRPVVKPPIKEVTQEAPSQQAPGEAVSLPREVSAPSTDRHGDAGPVQAQPSLLLDPEPAQSGSTSPTTGSPPAQASGHEPPPQMALTAKQIKAQNEKRAREIWDVVQRTLKTKFSATQRKSENNTKGMENLIEDEISDDELEAALKKVPAFYVQQFNLKKFHEMIPGLNATAQASPPQNGRSTPSTPEPPVIIRPANSVRSFNGIAKRAASQ